MIVGVESDFVWLVVSPVFVEAVKYNPGAERATPSH